MHVNLELNIRINFSKTRRSFLEIEFKLTFQQEKPQFQ